MKGTVLVAGLGLIGGSLCISIKRAHPQAVILGYDKDKNELNRAKELGIIDAEADSFQEAAESADLIILAAPVMQIVKLIELVQTFDLKENVLITDTGSVKKPIMKISSMLSRKGVAFIGGHPMAGSHKSGVAAAKDLLFENAYYILTPAEAASKDQIVTLEEWLKGTRAKFLTMKAIQHDELTGIISHFPHLVAASLVHTAKNAHGAFPLLSRLAAGGFKDTTRIASADPQMWSDITLQNSEVLIKLLKDWNSNSSRLLEMLEKQDEEKTYQFFSDAKMFRDGLPAKSKGAIPAFHDLFIDIPDHPGVISDITAHLAQEGISITNIRILEMREDTVGRLVISFQSNGDLDKAKSCLTRKTKYEVL
ncbi:prephenate dehydrogenase [Bacillus sp. AK031]